MPKKLNTRFLVTLSEAHRKSGRSIYEVAQMTGASYNTVRKYVLQPVICEMIPPEVYLLARYYGLSNEDAVSLISVDDPRDDTEMNSPVALPA